MVVILQQTTDNGRRFVSTVVEDEASLTSSFSGLSSSQNSISERSAIYKQRIDSLFGYSTRDSSNSGGRKLIPESFRPISGKVSSPRTNFVGETKMFNTQNSVVNISSEDEGYQRIDEDMNYPSSSVLPDSLKDTSCMSSKNISTVKLSSDSEDVQSTSLTPHVGSPNQMQIWKNGTYCIKSNTIPSDVQREIYKIQHGCLLERSSPANGILQFPVEYLGSVAVTGSTTALQDLQQPLGSLYLNFLTRKNMVSGQLAITTEGLRFEAPNLRLANPFNTISVWAAIKFVTRGESSSMECAFMPLISDPEGQDKRRLFGKMDSELYRVYSNAQMNTKKSVLSINPPMFACIMRVASYSLECHAFACRCAEDAIVVAANLYQSLVNKLKMQHKEGESGYGSLTRSSPATTDQNSPFGSSGDDQKRYSSSLCSTNSPTSEMTRGNNCDPIPVRPPRRKKKFDDGFSSGENLKRTNSEESLLTQKTPRRKKSFKLNAIHRSNYRKSKKRVKISTPDEMSTDSVNESVDEILDRIINSGGMSFNDLKPSYQELILKIAFTLTQDQLYKKSKDVMNKQHHRFPRSKKFSSKFNREKSDENSQFLANLFKPFIKMASGKVTSQTGKRFQRVKSTKTSPIPEKRTVPKVILKKQRHEDILQSICSGCMCDNCSEKCYCSLPSHKNNGKSESGVSMSPCLNTTSDKAVEEQNGDIKGTIQSVNPIKVIKKDCGYDTDSCAESEKCYCSLQGVKSNGLKVYNINLDTETSDTDTNSYDLEPFSQKHNTIIKKSPMYSEASSSKPVEILSYHPNRRFSYTHLPSTIPAVQTTKVHVHHFQNDSTSAGANVIKRPQQTTPVKKKSKLISIPSNSVQLEDNCHQSSPSLRQRKKVMLITGSNVSTQFYRDRQFQLRFQEGDSKDLGDILEEGNEVTETPSDTSKDAPKESNVLDMKKTAEIEAMFTNLRLEISPVMKTCQKQQWPYAEDGSIDVEQATNSVDFQTSLGYLP